MSTATHQSETPKINSGFLAARPASRAKESLIVMHADPT